jgi:acetylornithine deacetylase/succinyl-diaminopimelate desuccinylase-like protein
VNILVLAEGEEEVGSENLVPFLREHAEELACDHVVISDSNMFAEGMPSVLFSLRGLAYFEIHVTGARSDLHSGQFGGTLTNPGNALGRILASLHEGASTTTSPTGTRRPGNGSAPCPSTRTPTARSWRSRRWPVRRATPPWSGSGSGLPAT